jgi:hypothetical protein
VKLQNVSTKELLMKKVSILMIVLVILFGICLVSACSVAAVKSVEALVAATAAAERNTLLPIFTETRIPAMPTSSSIPTATPIPATSTPSRMDFPVENARFQIEVVGIERPYQIYLSDNLIFAPGKGKMFLGLGIKVTNLTNSEIPFKWNDIYLFNKYQDRWYPLWGAYKKTNMVIDPLGIEVQQFKVNPKEQPDTRVYFGDNGYLRVIFRLPRDNDYYYLAFADLPLIEINYSDH